MKIKFYVFMLVAIVSLAGCFESNPVIKKDIAKFNKFVQKSEYASLAHACADYYTKGFRGKVSRASTICSTFTRDLAKLSKKTGFAPDATFRDFRDKRLWNNWLKFLNIKGRHIDKPKQK